ncbi:MULTISPECIES: acyl carrier protein [Erwiniaceae]|uniref:Acyl carrier protein n=1 Tax=Pantoea coffeiphila TaxID=1465635 RepID=A0A2S9ICF3_9GAMM|nr:MULTISPECIES: acyl carrier protein [Erwiniaceae]MBK0002975.1 acyl carrier protein [Erwinia sp. S38]PRD15480.1 acyl carrier protein [Pantoea coffeiphila]
MCNRELLMDYILECIREMAPKDVEIKKESDLINDLGLESVQVMNLLMMLEDKLDISIPMNILLNVRTPEQLLETLFSYLESTNGSV